jgi:arylsulfatase A-like enzyme
VCWLATLSQAWAAAEYLDAVIGRVLDFVASSRLGSNTYVMISSDSGPQLLKGEEGPAAKLVGMPLVCLLAAMIGHSFWRGRRGQLLSWWVLVVLGSTGYLWRSTGYLLALSTCS